MGILVPCGMHPQPVANGSGPALLPVGRHSFTACRQWMLCSAQCGGHAMDRMAPAEWLLRRPEVIHPPQRTTEKSAREPQEREDINQYPCIALHPPRQLGAAMPSASGPPPLPRKHCVPHRTVPPHYRPGRAPEKTLKWAECPNVHRPRTCRHPPKKCSSCPIVQYRRSISAMRRETALQPPLPLGCCCLFCG